MRGSTNTNSTDCISREAARILDERGPAWEYRLFARVFFDEISAASDIRREFDRGIAFGPSERVADDEFATWASVRLGEVSHLAETAGRLVNEELPDALGPDGVPADPSDAS